MLKMENEENLKIEYLNKHGWIKVAGYRVETSAISDDYDYWFIEKNNDVVTECFFWKDLDDNDESCFDDLNEAVDYVEDTVEETFEHFKERKKKMKKYQDHGN